MIDVDLSGGVTPSPFHCYFAERCIPAVWDLRGGLAVPDALGDAVDEATALGASVGFGDISDRIVWTIDGAGTVAFLTALCGEAHGTFRAGQSRAALWCDALGRVRGSGRVALLSGEAAKLVTCVRDAVWFEQAAALFDVRLTMSPMAGLRLAGPVAASLIDGWPRSTDPTLTVEAPGLGPVLALTGAGDAVDLWCAPEEATALAFLLQRAGARPVGANALNAWRVAHGLLAAGVDWVPAQWATRSEQFRRREDLSHGGYLLAAWDGLPPDGVRHAVFWPVKAQSLALIWAPAEGGRAPGATGGGVILGSAATD